MPTIRFGKVGGSENSPLGKVKWSGDGLSATAEATSVGLLVGVATRRFFKGPLDADEAVTIVESSKDVITSRDMQCRGPQYSLI